MSESSVSITALSLIERLDKISDIIKIIKNNYHQKIKNYSNEHYPNIHNVNILTTTTMDVITKEAKYYIDEVLGKYEKLSKIAAQIDKNSSINIDYEVFIELLDSNKSFDKFCQDIYTTFLETLVIETIQSR